MSRRRQGLEGSIHKRRDAWGCQSWQRQKGSFPGASKGTQPFSALDFQLLASSACQRRNVCCFKPPTSAHALQPPKEARTGRCLSKECEERLELIKRKKEKPNWKMDSEGFQMSMDTNKLPPHSSMRETN